MKASAKIIWFHCQPNLLRVYPQPDTPEDQEWLLKATNEKLYLDFELSDDRSRSLLLGLLEAEVNARR